MNKVVIRQGTYCEGSEILWKAENLLPENVEITLIDTTIVNEEYPVKLFSGLIFWSRIAADYYMLLGVKNNIYYAEKLNRCNTIFCGSFEDLLFFAVFSHRSEYSTPDFEKVRKAQVVIEHK